MNPTPNAETKMEARRDPELPRPGSLSVGVYVPTDTFKAIKEHACVKLTSTNGLVALVGPADHPTSQKHGHLFAATPDLLMHCGRYGRTGVRESRIGRRAILVALQ